MSANIPLAKASLASVGVGVRGGGGDYTLLTLVG